MEEAVNHIYQRMIESILTGQVPQEDVPGMLDRYEGFREYYNAELARRTARNVCDDQWLGHGLEQFNAFFGDAK